jgi:hypothetical protein
MSATNDKFNRDEKGWRVPRQGTIARTIYDLHHQGVDKWFIAERIGRIPNYVAVALWKMEHPDKANETSTRKKRQRRAAERETEQRKAA